MYYTSAREGTSGGTLNVPVTVDWLPHVSTTFGVIVTAARTGVSHATEYADSANPGDYRIETKSVTFAPDSGKTQYLSVAITDDTEVEGFELIQLELASLAGDSAVNVAYSRRRPHAQIYLFSDDGLPGEPGNLSVEALPASLELSWTKPSGNVTGYAVHYTSSTTATAFDEATGSNPAAGWVTVSRSGVATTQTISDLVNARTYRVRVAAVNATGTGPFAHDTGTPMATPVVTLAVAPNPVAEGGSVAVTVALSRALDEQVTVPITVTSDTAESGDHGRISSITIPSGTTSRTAAIATTRDHDGDDETFTVALGAPLPAGIEAGAESGSRITITDFGSATVSVSASPARVVEGSPVTVTVTLSSALKEAVTVSFRYDNPGTGDPAEPGDYVPLDSITVPRGATSATGTITTVADPDDDSDLFHFQLATPLGVGLTADPRHTGIYIRIFEPNQSPTPERGQACLQATPMSTPSSPAHRTVVGTGASVSASYADVHAE